MSIGDPNKSHYDGSGRFKTYYHQFEIKFVCNGGFYHNHLSAKCMSGCTYVCIVRAVLFQLVSCKANICFIFLVPMINDKYERKQTRIVPETFFKINMKTKSLKLIFKNIFVVNHRQSNNSMLKIFLSFLHLRFQSMRPNTRLNLSFNSTSGLC